MVGLIVIPLLGWIPKPSEASMSAYLGIGGLFTFMMFVETLKLNRALKFVFGSLTVLFVLSAISDGTRSKSLGQFAGYEGIICGLSAIYTGIAQVLNDVFGKNVLQIAPVA